MGGSGTLRGRLVIALAAIGAVTLGTLGLGAWGVRFARTTSDLLVASRAVTAWWNADCSHAMGNFRQNLRSGWGSSDGS